MCIMLFLTATSFGMEIVLPLLVDQQKEELASFTDNNDEDDSDDESEAENLKGDLFFETLQLTLMHSSLEKNAARFGHSSFTLIALPSEVPFCPPEMLI